MKRLFVTLLLGFLSSLFIFLLVMSSISFIGFRRSALNWGLEKKSQIENQLEEVLKEIFAANSAHDPRIVRERVDPIVPQGVQFVLYDESREQIYTHRPAAATGRRGAGPGSHRMRTSPFTQQNQKPQLSLKPVKIDGNITGYYSLGFVGFAFDRANQSFLESMRKTALVSIAFSFVLAFVFALLSSKSISGPAKRVAEGIQRMAQGKLSIRIPEKGAAEITRIAKSANSLGKKLEREEELRRQWTADIAHDLRTPISALKSQLEGMSDGVLDLKKERIEKNLNEVLKIERLVDDLGELTRLESPEMKLEPSKIDVRKFLLELKNRFDHEISGKKLQVAWDSSVDTLFGDENLLLRAVSNLISNAVRYTDHGGKVRVSLGRQKEEYILTVFNTGKAIPEAEICKLFDRLYRGEYARKTQGSGLGLTITKQIVELHNGDVFVSSKEGHGTTFTMTLGASIRRGGHDKS